jgi:class 3 adenylate cyclase
MTPDHSLDGFLPVRFIQRLCRPAPAEVRFEGAALFADISGYTVLTETLVARGEEGLEQLSTLLDRAFGHYVRMVHDHGGEVVYFAGDALLAYWPVECATTLADTARSAVECCEHLHASPAPVDGSVRPQLHVGIGCGGLWGARVGDDEYAHFVFGGSAVREAVHLGADAKIGASARSDRTTAALAPGMPGDLASSGGPSGPSSAPGSFPPAPRAHLVPRVVVDRAGHDAVWSAELRHATSLFVHVEPFDEDAPGALELLDGMTREVHHALRSFSSSPGRWLIDDKGLVFLVVFGVPHNAHKDDRARALRAAAAIRAALDRLGVSSSAGVASGNAFCGPIGAPFRREYVTIGRPMNMAARLMASHRGLLYAGPIAGIEQDDIELSPVAALQAKGFAQAVPTFAFGARESAPSQSAPLHGRDDERAALRRTLERLLDGTGGAVILRGEAGLGKSRLVLDLVARAREAGVAVLLAGNEPAEYAAAYSPWRAILRELLGVRPSDDADSRRLSVERWLERHPELSPSAPLLAKVLRVDLPETDVTRHLDGPARRERTSRLLAEVIAVAAPRPALVVLEDCHWMDPDSWRLSRTVATFPHVLVVLTSRPVPPQPGEERFCALPGLVELDLAPLALDAIAAIAKHCLGDGSVAGGLVKSVHERSAGNPLVAIEYALLLRESRRAVLQGGHWVLLGREGHESGSLTSVSVRGLVAGRIDNLTAAQGMMLKAAAAIGPTFSSGLLRQILPAQDDGELRRVLADLVSHQLVGPADVADEYAFRHDLIREVGYDLMLHEQRRALHASIARALKARAATGAVVEDSLLAHHWFSAGDLERTARHADVAGAKALQAGAYREAIYFIELCIKCDSELQRPTDPSTSTRWRRQLADAHHGLGELGMRRKAATAALDAARHTAEPSRAAMAASVTLRLAHELAASALPRAATRFRLRRRGIDADLDLAKVYRHLVELSYFDNDGLGMLWGALHAVEAADRAGLLSDLSRAYAQLGGALGLARTHALAIHFLRRGIEVARQASEPHAEAYAHMCNCLYMVGVGRWDDVHWSTTECQRLAVRTRDSLIAGNAQIVRFWMHYYRGEVRDAHRTGTEFREQASRAGHAQHEAWALRCLGLLAARAHASDEAIALLEESRAILSQTRDANELISTNGALALARLQRADFDGAEEAARRTLGLASGTRRPTSHATLGGLLASIEVVFALRAIRPRDPAWAALARTSVDTLRRYHRVFAVAGPAYLYWRGAMRSVGGDARGAMADWKRGLKGAEALELRPDADNLRRAIEAGHPLLEPRRETGRRS